MMPARAVVYATTTSRVQFGDGRFSLRENDPWDANDPLVKARPELFAKQPTKIHTTQIRNRRVEQATAAPGEVRG